ncbi:radiation-inducible immediate-early gene IEX-1-like [Pristis pectinata]|uniref:radiation-inducible immediate-early gene IEX-1-like n=1 Tax=Pristis pectinata TaxID=685728 RepID=UPI00223E0168|nr:radiation-inducible immediate-early gene IEX-1-like [Pristis pectinata]
MHSTVAHISASSNTQNLSNLSTRRYTEPEVFTFDAIPEPKYGRRSKRRSLKVLYPIYQPRKTLPAEKDVAKRILLCLLSIVALQVYLVTDHPDELSVIPKGVEVGTGGEFSLLSWPLWMSCSTSFLDSLQGVQVNITCPTGHVSHSYLKGQPSK